MKNIINITPLDMPAAPGMGKEDTAYFADRFKGCIDPQAYADVMQSIYKHGYEDGYRHGRRYGKIIKLVNV